MLVTAGKSPLYNVLVALGYLSMALLVERFVGRHDFLPAPIWPPAGVALVAALQGGWRLAPGIFIGSLLSQHLLLGAGFWLSAAVSAGNTLGPLWGAWLIRRFTDTSTPFQRLGDLLYFILFGVGLHVMFTAGFGMLSTGLAEGLSLAQGIDGWWRWLIGDGSGVLLFAPATILWLKQGRIAIPLARLAECVALSIAIAWVSAWIFFATQGEHEPVVLPYLLVPLLMWGAIRFEQRISAAWTVAIILIAAAGTLRGRGPFASVQESALLDLGVMTMVLTLAVLAIGAIVAERRQAEADLVDAKRDLEWQVEQRVKELRNELDERKRIEKELKVLATTDHLTGIANRRHFMEQTEKELNLARRHQYPFALLIFDLDHFKMVNDNFGHHAGDEALRRVVKIIMMRLRDTDLFGRIGGEEFAIALPSTDLEGARVAAEGLRQAVEESESSDWECPVGVTISVGVAQLEDSDEELDVLMRRADQALYVAKEGGRNRVVAA